SVAAVVNADPDVAGRIKIVFLPDYNVSVAELVVAAGNVSEQISLAGMEASGTGNMKLALNGALTIGTLDGANIEIRDRVGADNMFIFGLTADEVAEQRRAALEGRQTIAPSRALTEVLEMIETGVFSPGQPDRFAMLTDRLREADQYMLVADFDEIGRA